MALIILNSGETSGPFGGFSSDQVFGTAGGSETAVIAANGVVTLDGSFNAGGDTISILGNAGDYTASVDGSILVLTSAGGANIRIPFGVNGAIIEFLNATRELIIEGGELLLGDQVIEIDGLTEVEPGDGEGGNGGQPGEDFQFTNGRDNLEGTSGNDSFDASLDPVNGLQVNSLNTGDRAYGSGGSDKLYAQITRGSTYGSENAAIQPRLDSIETLKLEALQSDLPSSGEEYDRYGNNTQVYFNAKDVTGHDTIWSWRSDADLIIQDLTTLKSGVDPREGYGAGDARDTGDITIGMGYTGSDNSRWDASDLSVFFDPDFLLSGQASQSEAFYFILDQDADLVDGPLLDNINVDGIRFRVDGGPIITLRDPNAQDANTHANFVAILQDELQALIDAGIVPADTILYVDPSVTRTTFLDDGSVSSPIPAIVLQTNTAAIIEPVGFSQVEDALGEYNVFGRLEQDAGVEDIPVSVQIALEKAGEAGGEACDGGELIVGSMDKYDQGIPVFNVTVYGDASRPSILRTMSSTGGALDVVNIVSDNTGFPTDTYASLKIGSFSSEYDDGQLTLVDATGFFGDLELGGCGGIENLQTLIATGGGNVTFIGEIYSSNVYSYTTGAGDDVIDLEIYGEALDYGSDSLAINTGAGNDHVYTYFNPYSYEDNEVPNQVILNNVDINTGDGNDVVWTEGVGNFRINTGSGNDTIYTDNSGDGGQWVFNVDMGAFDGPYDNTGDLPGVPLQKSLIGGGKLTVVFSGAGVESNGGGGVMYLNGLPGNEGAAIATKNGIEVTVDIVVDGPNVYYGTQKDINDAMLKAINENAVLNKVLYAYIADNNTLVVESLIDGYFETEDLNITITRPTGNFTDAMRAEAIANGLGTSGTVPATGTPIGNADSSGAGYGQSLHNAFYSGVDNSSTDASPFDNLNYSGYAGSFETDNVINAGAGDDVIVLSTDSVGDAYNGYWSLDGQLYDDASNEVIQLTGLFGKDTVFNFTVAGVEDYTPTPPEGAVVPADGFDFLDVRSYMQGTNDAGNTFIELHDLSGGNTPQDMLATVTLEAREVSIIDFISDTSSVDGDPVQLFAGLTATVVQNAINNVGSFGNYGNLDGGEFSMTDTAGTATTNSTVLMVQNDMNLGEYKFFQVTWTNSAGDANPPVAAVTELGTVDFGASLQGIDEINFVGSQESTLFDGYGLNAFGSDTGPFA